MGWRLVVQPNGLLARFSTVVDNFTDYDLLDHDVPDLCGNVAWLANQKIDAARANPNRFKEAIELITEVHGEAEADEVRRLLSSSAS